VCGCSGPVDSVVSRSPTRVLSPSARLQIPKLVLIKDHVPNWRELELLVDQRDYPEAFRQIVVALGYNESKIKQAREPSPYINPKPSRPAARAAPAPAALAVGRACCGQVSLAAAHLIESAVVTNYVKFGSRTLLTRTRRVVHDSIFERGWQCAGRTVLWISRRVGHCHSRLVANEVEVTCPLPWWRVPCPRLHSKSLCQVAMLYATCLVACCMPRVMLYATRHGCMLDATRHVACRNVSCCLLSATCRVVFHVSCCVVYARSWLCSLRGSMQAARTCGW
jgi:hypothetical protein